MNSFRLVVNLYSKNGAYIGGIVGNIVGLVLGYLYVEDEQNPKLIERIHNTLPGSFVGRIGGEIVGRVIGSGIGIAKYYCTNGIVSSIASTRISTEESQPKLQSTASSIGRTVGYIVGLPIGYLGSSSNQAYFLTFETLMSSFVSGYTVEHVFSTCNDLTFYYNKFRGNRQDNNAAIEHTDSARNVNLMA